ncbi:hypothetical protein JOD15_000596 [Enterococcus ureilyticus]|nr:hypothetical protein [Enterococcus ureilyticus]
MEKHQIHIPNALLAGTTEHVMQSFKNYKKLI